MPTRYLKPGIRDSDRIEAIQSPDAEIMYYRLLVTVDDFGRSDARPAMVKAACFPIRSRATADKCAQWVKELEKSGLLFTYEVDGKPYLQITKWENKARSQLSKFPNPPTDADNPRALADIPCASLPGTGTGTGTGTENREPKKAAGKPDLSTLISLGVEEQVAKDWLTARKSPLTKTALKGVEREATKAGISIAQAITICAEKGWRGFDASWKWKDSEAAGSTFHGETV